MVATLVLGILSLLFLVLYVYLKWCLTYWERRKVKTLPSRLPTGTFPYPLADRVMQGVKIKKMYDQFKEAGAEHGPIYVWNRPGYISMNPETNRVILAQEFQHFADRGLYHNETHQPISQNIFFASFAKWRYLRNKLTPSFSSGKMKFMFDVIADCAKPMEEYVDSFCRQKTSMDAKDVCIKFTTNVIGTCAFGLECNCFQEPDGDFSRWAWKMLKPTWVMHIFELLQVLRSFFQLLGVKIIDKDVDDFFTGVIRETVQVRERNQIQRGDFMHLLIELKNHPEPDKRITMSDLYGEAFVFFIAGLDTSSGILSFGLLELAQHLGVQTKLRNEIREVLGRNGGQVTYESLQEMVYLQQVIDEVVRKYPSLAVLNRECTSDFTFEDGFKIEKGTLIYIPVLAMQNDPDYFPDPHKFDPERFSKEQKDQMHPYQFLPFGGGPRSCIGKRFGLLQVKIGFVALLNRFEYRLDPRTKIPIEFNFNFGTHPKGTIYVQVQRLQN